MKSERFIIVLALCAICAAQVLAQPRLKQPEFYLGAHGGVTASTVYFNPAQDYMTPITQACVLGGNGGLVFRYAGHKYCAFQTEINYLHRGWTVGSESGEKTRHSLHYIEVPIFMHINAGSDLCKWFFNLGPQIGYCIADESHTIDHPFDWGVAAGTGFYFLTKHAGLYHLEIRYDFSFGGVFGTKVTDKYNMANPMDLSLNLGWMMPIKSRKAKGVSKHSDKYQRPDIESRRPNTEHQRIHPSSPSNEESRKQKKLEKKYQIH